MGTSFTKWGEEFDLETPDDNDREPPWINDDGAGFVEQRREDARKGEVEIGHDRTTRTIYLYNRTLKKAMSAKGWGFKEPAKARAAVDADMERMRQWVHGGWNYVGVVVTHIASGQTASCWGVESDCKDYIKELAEGDLAHEAFGNRFHIEMYEAAHLDPIVRLALQLT